MPTGLAIRDVRDQLFGAAERIIVRDGPGALTSRAVTAEAGCAKGVLYAHFEDFDHFLAELVLDRIARLDSRADALIETAGNGSVVTNITDELCALFSSVAIAIVALFISRDELRLRLRAVRPVGVPLASEAATMLAAYLARERDLGRLSADADIAALAPTLVGAGHLLFVGADGMPSKREVAQVVRSTLHPYLIEGAPRRRG